MKKTFILSAVIISGIFCAQKHEFSAYSNNVELVKIKNSIKENQKTEFYKQYLKNELTEDMKSTFIFKKYSDIVLTKFADTLLTYDSSTRYLDQGENISIKNLDNLIGSKNDAEKINENLTALLGDFPKIVKIQDATEHTAFEIIPGEILEIYYWGGGNMTSQIYYKVSNNDLKNINVIPEEDKNFLKTVKQNIGKKNITFFSSKGNSYSSIEKNPKDKFYVIGASLFLEEDNFAPIYEIEYKTTDFKNFIPVRIKSSEENSKWKTIK